jgi:D-alanyl-lipoteichoic acid acyltransferase DltB (MBOAT superfamily)
VLCLFPLIIVSVSSVLHPKWQPLLIRSIFKWINFLHFQLKKYLMLYGNEPFACNSCFV